MPYENDKKAPIVKDQGYVQDRDLIDKVGTCVSDEGPDYLHEIIPQSIGSEENYHKKEKISY